MSDEVRDDDPDALCLARHAVRLLGMADAAAVERRFGVALQAAAELLLDAEAYGWVRRVGQEPDPAWALTDAGRAHGERLLAADPDARGVRESVVEAHASLLAIDGRFLTACPRWQLRPLPGDPLAANDHTDPRWERRLVRVHEDLIATLGLRRGDPGA